MAFFAIASLAVLVDQGKAHGVLDAVVSLFVTGPLVATALLIAPIAILADCVRSWRWIAAAQVLMAPVIVAVPVMVAVEGKKHSTAGIGLIYIPLVCSALAAAASIGERLLTRRW